MTVFNVNADAVVAHTRRLERINRSALPVAVRNTLNSAAFDVKMNEMSRSADAAFIRRQPNFFKANSRVEKATGFSLQSMQATVGFISLGGTNYAVDDLQQQEHGGGIGGRTFIPLAQARTGNSWQRKPKAMARISGIDNIVDAADNENGANAKEKFIRSAIHAGKGGWIIGDRKTGKGNRILHNIRSIVRKGKNTVVKSVPMFAVEKGRVVQPRATHFMEKASVKSANKMDELYIAHAEKQIQRYRK